MDSREYEQAVARLYDALGKPQGSTQVTWNKRLNSKSGRPYQIDILIEGSNGLQIINTAIECKYLTKKVGREVVAAFATTIEDTMIEKGVVVTTVGFTKGALALAKEKNIDLVEMREPTEDDWEGAIKTVHIALHMSMPYITDIEFIQEELPEGTVERVSLNTNSGEIFIQPPGNDPSLLSEILNAEANSRIGGSPLGCQTVQREILFPEGTILSVSGYAKSAVIKGIKFKLKTITAEEEIVIDGTEVVQFIVNEIFQGRHFNIDKDGQVHEIIDTAN